MKFTSSEIVKVLLTSSLFFIVSFAQSERSIHKEEYKYFRNNLTQDILVKNDTTEIIPLQYKKRDLTKTVFGYLPFWEYYNSRNYIRYDLLTHIALFDFTVDSMGNVFNPYYWPWTDVINKAHLNGVKVILTAVNFESLQIKNILRNQTAKTNFFNQVKDKMLQYHFDGINVDFEDLKSEDRGSVLNTFMSELTEFIKFYKTDAEVSFAGPSINWGGWDLRGLVESCDYIFIMGYSFYGSWSSTTGASAPLSGGTYNINNVVNTQYSWATANAPEKLILGVPYYGEKWKTATELPHSAVTKYISTTRFKDDVDSASYFGRLWAVDNKVPWYRFQRGGEWYQVWYDDDSSLGLKYDLADSKNYKGIGMWALGYDGNKPHLWNEIEKRYKPLSIDNRSNTLNGINHFELFQNYPNPFNPSTKIRFVIDSKWSTSEYVLLQIYDISGREVVKLVDGYLVNGLHQIDFNIDMVDEKILTSSVYFYRLNIGGKTLTKKMIYLK